MGQSICDKRSMPRYAEGMLLIDHARLWLRASKCVGGVKESYVSQTIAIVLHVCSEVSIEGRSKSRRMGTLDRILLSFRVHGTNKDGLDVEELTREGWDNEHRKAVDDLASSRLVASKCFRVKMTEVLASLGLFNSSLAPLARILLGNPKSSAKATPSGCGSDTRSQLA